MPETGDGTQGLAKKSAPVRGSAVYRIINGSETVTMIASYAPISTTPPEMRAAPFRSVVTPGE